MTAPSLYSTMKTRQGRIVNTQQRIGEAATYKPDGGSERSIRVVVKREDPEAYGNTYPQLVRIRVDNDATTGITPSELNEGLDKINVAMEPGGTASDRVIKRIHSQNAVRLLLEVE